MIMIDDDDDDDDDDGDDDYDDDDYDDDDDGGVAGAFGHGLGTGNDGVATSPFSTPPLVQLCAVCVELCLLRRFANVGHSRVGS